MNFENDQQKTETNDLAFRLYARGRASFDLMKLV